MSKDRKVSAVIPPPLEIDNNALTIVMPEGEELIISVPVPVDQSLRRKEPRPFVVCGERRIRGTAQQIIAGMEDLRLSYNAWLATVLPVVEYSVKPELGIYRDLVNGETLVKFSARGWLDDDTPGTLWVELP